MSDQNHTFQQWTRSVAFQLSLNHEAIMELVEMWAFDLDALAHGKDPSDYGAQFGGRQNLCSYLARRGLIAQTKRGTWYLTKAGQLTAQLLNEAGFHAKTKGSVFA